MKMEVQILRSMRTDKRLTADEAAAAVGVSREAYLAIESGTSRGAEKALEKLVRIPPRWDRPENYGE